MHLGLYQPYAGQQLDLPISQIQQAEALGFDSVWVSEVYGADAISQASWVLAKTERIKVGTAIMQMPSRTPAMAAMTAMSLSQLSAGRFIVGLGASGPQVIEGWHGVPYGKPISRTREYIEVMRRVMAREGPLQFDGEIYQIPFAGDGSTGLGKPLKSLLAADTDIPVYSAAITPAGLACAAEVADGVLPVWMSPDQYSVVEKHLKRGFAKRSNGYSRNDFFVAPGVMVVLGDDIEQCRQPVKEMLALYIGGMGAKGANFYTFYAMALGYENEALEIQTHYLEGNKKAAVAAVPDRLVDEIALVGNEQHIRLRAQRWLDAEEQGYVDGVLIQSQQPEVLPLMADIFL
jgi:F420-dependent oxidoreductase-like protein